MHVGLLTCEWFPDEDGGGIATYCRCVAAEAARQGHDVTVIAGTRRPERDGTSSRGGVRLVAVLDAGTSAASQAEAFTRRWRELPAVGRGIDVIEAAEFGGPAAYLAAAPGAPPVVTRLHTPLALILERNGGGRVCADDAERCRLERQQVRASVLLTSPSRWLAREGTRLWDLDREPSVIPNPVRLVRRRPMPPPTDGTPFRALFFGRLEHRKGVLQLCEAVRPLVEDGRLAMTFVGSDTAWNGQSVKALMGRALETGATPRRCSIQPRIDSRRLARLMDRSHLVVLPSLYENFSYACLEAMGRGKAVLATTGSGFEDMIEHGSTGLLVEPGSSDALRCAIRDCIAGRWDLARIGRQAAASIGRFGAPVVVERLSRSWEAARTMGSVAAPAGDA